MAAKTKNIHLVQHCGPYQNGARALASMSEKQLSEVRDDYIQRDPLLRKIYDDYRQLKDESHDARCDARVTHTQSDSLSLQDSA